MHLHLLFERVIIWSAFYYAVIYRGLSHSVLVMAELWKYPSSNPLIVLSLPCEQELVDRNVWAYKMSYSDKWLHYVDSLHNRVGAPVSGNGIIMEIRPRNRPPTGKWPATLENGVTSVLLLCLYIYTFTCCKMCVRTHYTYCKKVIYFIKKLQF